MARTNAALRCNDRMILHRAASILVIADRHVNGVYLASGFVALGLLSLVLYWVTNWWGVRWPRAWYCLNKISSAYNTGSFLRIVRLSRPESHEAHRYT